MPHERSASTRRLIVGCGLVLLAFLFRQLGPGRIFSMLSTLGPNFLAIVALFACHECVRAYAVCQCFPVDRRPSWRRVLRIRFLGEAVGTLTRTGAFGAEPTRAWMLADHAGTGRLGYEAAASELIVNSCASAAISVAVAAVVLVRSGAQGPLLILCHILCWSSLAYASVIVVTLAAR